MATEDAQLTLPYCPYNAFEGFVQKLKETAVPPVVDRSTMRNLSGSAQTALLSALKFLKLIQDSGHARPALETLAGSFGTEGWHNALSDVVCEAYSTILSGLDIDKASQKSLRDAFKGASGSDGTALDKAIRFYLQAMKAARVTVSPHFSERKPRSPSAPKRTAGATSGTGSQNSKDAGPPPRPPKTDTDEDKINPMLRRWAILIPGKADGYVALPENLMEDDLPIVEAALAGIRAYAKLRGGRATREASA